MSPRFRSRDLSPEASTELPEVRGPRCQPKSFDALVAEEVEAARLREGMHRR